ncbi:MAG: DUF3035 domain-containing protein [Pseudomonadota bacterium]
MRHILCIIAITALGACSGEPDLRNLRSLGNGPDEFALVPSKPLEAPESYIALPQPTPGGVNRTDQRPLEEAYASLGGRATSPSAPIPGADAALVNHATRFGVEPGIRTTLASADQKFRDRQRRLSNIRLFKEDIYAQIYRRQALNPARVAAQYRAAGIPTPSAPPANRRRRR